jgi:hypothetical protein
VASTPVASSSASSSGPGVRQAHASGTAEIADDSAENQNTMRGAGSVSAMRRMLTMAAAAQTPDSTPAAAAGVSTGPAPGRTIRAMPASPSATAGKITAGGASRIHSQAMNGMNSGVL